MEVATGKTISEFHSYVRPQINPCLSDFCTSLTGISQSQVDNAPLFPVVFREFKQWLYEHDLLKRNDSGRFYPDRECPPWTFVTDGMADICRFLALQCSHSGINFPFDWAGRYCNVKKIFQNAYRPKFKVKILDMLEIMGLEFQGRLHR